MSYSWWAAPPAGPAARVSVVESAPAEHLRLAEQLLRQSSRCRVGSASPSPGVGAAVDVPRARVSGDRALAPGARVLVVHPDPLVRRALAERVRSRESAATVVEAEGPGEARAAASGPGRRDLAIVGLDAIGRGARLLVVDLHELCWERVVVLVAAGDGHAAIGALSSGVTGVVTGSVFDVAGPEPAGRARTAADALAGSWVLDTAGVPRLLSGRERQILQLAAIGRPSREIGEELGLSVLTVKSHLSRIGRKLGSGDRAHLVLLALRAGAIG